MAPDEFRGVFTYLLVSPIDDGAKHNLAACIQGGLEPQGYKAG